MAVRPLLSVGIPERLDEGSHEDLSAPFLQGPKRLAEAGMNKFERIQLVRRLGLNTEVSVLVDTEQDLLRYRDFLDRFDTYSVRTFSRVGYEGVEPHFPIIRREVFARQAASLLKEGRSLIVAEPIDPSRAKLAGCILRQQKDFVVEVALGPGTVRRVTHDGLIDERHIISEIGAPGVRPEIRSAVRELLRAERRWREQVALNDVLYEFSVYREPVGWKRRRVIFWEIKGIGQKDSQLQAFYRGVELK